MDTELPFLGVGICFHPSLWALLERLAGQVDFVEVVTERYVAFTGKEREELRRLAERFPLVAHGRAIAIGKGASLDKDYLGKVDQVLQLSRAKWFSEPLGWSQAGADAACRNIEEIRQYIDLPFLLETIPAPHAVSPEEMGEAALIARIAEESGCALALDLASLHARALAHGFDACAFLGALPLERMVEVHVGGSTPRHACSDAINRVTTNEAHPAPATTPGVWELLAFVKTRAPLKAVVVECDAHSDPTEMVSHLTAARKWLER